MNEIALLDSVHKRHGAVKALNGLTFNLHKGEIVCLLGPNGAGKSTTLSLLLGLTHPTEGSITIFGGSAFEKTVRARIGCTPQDTDFPDYLTVEEVLQLISAHYPQPENLEDVLEKFGLGSLRKRRTHALSGGQRRCLALACAFIGKPDLVLLDEPTTGLDVDIRRRLWTAVRDFALQGKTVLFTTHYLDEAEELATRVLLMKDGRVLREGDVPSIKSALGMKTVSFNLDQDLEIDVKGKVLVSGSRYNVLTPEPEVFVRQLALRYDGFRDLAVEPLRLEDAFLLLMSDQEKETSNIEAAASELRP